MAKDKKTDKESFSPYKEDMGKEDMHLWHKVASTVRRYLPVEDAKTETESFASLIGDAPKPIQPQPKAEIFQEKPVKAIKPAPDIHSGVDGRTMAKLKKGQLPIEAILDLHGMNLDKAHTKCISFLKGAQIKGHRCVLIITGKGKFSKEKVGVIKKHFPEWMHEDPLSKIVLSFTSAHIKDGGSGAYYVLLRKIK